MNIWSKSLTSGLLGCTLAAATSVGVAYAATAMIKVTDQKLTGDEVTIADANLPKDGFVVVHPSDAKGNLIERSIGYVALKAGDHKAVKVKLTEAHKPGDKLWVMLHEDTGVKGTYEFGMAGKAGVDAPLMESGKAVEEAFKLQ